MPSVTFSEHTERPDFVNYLKEKLGLNFRVYQEINNIDDEGHRHQADVVIFDAEKIDVNLSSGELRWTSDDAVIAIIETKIHREDNLEQHESQLLQYLDIFKCKIGFLTNYSSIISYTKSGDEEKKYVYIDDDLENIAYFIADVIERESQITIKKSPEDIMRFLESVIEDLTVFTSRIAGNEWEAHLRLSDASELEEKKKEYTKKELADRALFIQRSAAYIAIAQIMFYITFRQYRIDQKMNENPSLAPLSAANGIPTQIQEILEVVPNNNLNFKAILGKQKEVFSHLDDDASDTLKSIISILESISAKFVIENDLIGQIFQRLLPYETRKKFAAYYTLGKAAELICQVSIDEKNETVFDPACGSGTLLVNAYKRKQRLGLRQHKKILEEIRGSDISDIATMMSTINLAIQDPSKWTNHVNIFQFDAIEFSFGLSKFQQHYRETPNGREEINVRDIYDLYKPVNVLLANPPFTRGSRLTQTQRKKLRGLPLVIKYKLSLDFSRINFYAFFMLIAPSLVTEEGKIAFVMPQGAINSQTMIDIWKVMFKEGFGLKYIIEASDIDESFSDSEDQEIIIVLKKKYEGTVKLVKILGHLYDKNLTQIVKQISKAEVPYQKTDDLIILVLDQKEIQSLTCMEWNLNPSQMMKLAYQNYIPLDIDRLPTNQKTKYHSDLKSFIKIVTENATRPVDYWFLPNKYWEIIKKTKTRIYIQSTSKNAIATTDNQQMSLPSDAFIPAIARSLRQYRQYAPIIKESEIENYYLTNEKRSDLKEYFDWGKLGHEKGLFGPRHGNHSSALNSGGIVKRINFTNSKTLALRFLEPKMGTQIIRFGFYSREDINSNIFFAYLSSSLFILDALEKSRKRSAEYVIINQIDFFTLYRFPNLAELKKDQPLMKKIIECSEKLYGTQNIEDIDLLNVQIRKARVNSIEPRRQLDEAWFQFLNIPTAMLDMLYQEIEEKMKDILKK